MSEAWKSPRAIAEERRRSSIEAFEQIMTWVDDGQLERDAALAVMSKLAVFSIVEVQTSPLFQARQIAKLERSIDDAEAGDAS